MVVYSPLFLVFGYVLLTIISLGRTENPCAARQIKGQSVVCVCNETYCDDVTREPPDVGTYVTYTSSKAGLRFNLSQGRLSNRLEDTLQEECCETVLTIIPQQKYQTIEGFGGAVTDAAAINWKKLSTKLQSSLINSYFSERGLQYNMVRVPIGGSDFSTHPYAYNEIPANDTALTNYTLSIEDSEFKIPMIRAAQSASNDTINVVATTWSPPPWMKTNNAFVGASRLKEEYYQTYADYHIKFIDLYNRNGIPIWAITTTNEPLNGIVALNYFNSLGWMPDEMGRWIVNNLGPTVRNSTYSDLKIFTMDDQRFMIPIWFYKMVKEHPKVLDYIDGLAVHYYADFISPTSFIAEIPRVFPGKVVLATEACQGSFPWQRKVVLGSWKRAEVYVGDIIQDLNSDVVGWIDWNLCLNQEGGPNWVKNFVDSPIIVFPEDKEFVKQPMFYAMGHFSKFIPRGSKRIKVVKTYKKNEDIMFFKSVEYVAFLTTLNTVVVVLHNSRGYKSSLSVKIGDKYANLKLEAHSITTAEFSYEALSRKKNNN